MLDVPCVDTLPNGVRVVCDPMAGIETAALGVWVNAGTLDETSDEHGLAHLLEHMAFKGTKTRSARDIAIQIEEVGASLDAATSHQRTGYYARMLPEHASLIVDILGDIMTAPVFSEHDLTLEKEVVIQEIGEAADEPDDILFEKLAEVAWGYEGLGKPILGTPESVRAQSPSGLSGFMEACYRGPSMIVASAGAMTRDMTLDLAQKAFGDLPAEEPARTRPEPVWRGGLSHTHRPTEQSHLAFAFPGVGLDNERYIALRMFADVLGGGMSSRLFQKVREEKGLAYSVYAFADVFDRGGLVGAYLGTDADKAELALELTLSEISDMAEGVANEELMRVKSLARANLLMARESVPTRAEGLAGQLLAFGDIKSPDESLERVMHVTCDDISSVARDILNTGKPALSIVGTPDPEPLWKRLISL